MRQSSSLPAFSIHHSATCFTSTKTLDTIAMTAQANERLRIIIVGAGIAGLAAAGRCARITKCTSRAVQLQDRDWCCDSVSHVRFNCFGTTHEDADPLLLSNEQHGDPTLLAS